MAKLSETYNLLALHRAVADEWDYERNESRPEEYTPSSNKKVFWKCSKCDHRWETRVNDRTNRNRGCPACAGQVATSQRNLTITNPQLVLEIDTERTSIDPTTLTPSSSKKVFWKCSKCDHRWETTVNSRTNGRGCPACAGHVATSQRNLTITHPQLVLEIDTERTSIDPTTLTPSSGKKVFWKCSKCDHRWETRVIDRTIGKGCPACAKKYNKTEDAFRENLEYLTGVAFPQKRIPLIRQKSKSAQVDMINHDLMIIVEYDGSYWHHKRVAHDTHTTEAMIKAGYKVIRIREETRQYKLAKLVIDDSLEENLYQITHIYEGENMTTIEEICQKIITDKMEWFSQTANSHENSGELVMP